MSELCDPGDTRMVPATKSLRPPDSFRREAEAFGLAFDSGDLERLGSYLAMLLDANTRFNLTAISDPDGAWIKHIFDSLTLLPYIASAQATRVIDVGSGGGLPGVPLAIAIPAMQFTLLEATGKKAKFLRDVIQALELSNVEVINDRAETLGHDPHHREHYDVVVARAVGRLATLLELTVPLAAVGGHVLTIKGRKAIQEISDAKKALHLLHCAVVETSHTPTGTIVVIKKLRGTAKRYPRRPGEPKRAPL
ncbi:MAG: 16S rRNA (guanine(527)-N(7))-methyltransferase RsmG [Planctomycetes bacterium]|nr:16S rRNA (guanine(527)-N(7))-methyltransferase RsmG [Planctomycetota bacterium]